MHLPALPSMQETLLRFTRAQRSPRTAKAYSKIVEAFLASVDGSQTPHRRDVDHFLAKPLKSGERASIAMYNQKLAAIRAFARFAMNDGLWECDPTTKLRFLREHQRDPAVLFVPEVQRFFRAVSHATPAREHARNHAILALCFVLGLRLSELARLDVWQVDVETSTVLAVVRKGGRQQNLPLERGALELLQRWLAERPERVQADETALFVSSRGTRLSGRSIERLFERLRNHVGTPKRVTPHTARHSFITIELALGADISVVSRLAGHASVTTTMRYRHLLEHEPREAVGRLGVLVPEDVLSRGAEPMAAPAGRSTRDVKILGEAPIFEGEGANPANDNAKIPFDDQEDLVDSA